MAPKRSGLRGAGQGGACGPHRPLLEWGGLQWGGSWGPNPDQQRRRPAPRDVSLLLGDDRSTGAAYIGGDGLRGTGRRWSPQAHYWLLWSVSARTGELARTPGVAGRVVLLVNTWEAGALLSMNFFFALCSPSLRVEFFSETQSALCS